jgi:protein SCO1/2
MGNQPLTAVLVALAVLGGVANLHARESAPAEPPPSARVRLSNPPVVLPEFTLTNQDGKTGTLGELASGTRLVFFGFTHCPNVCPPALQKMRQVQRAVEAEGNAKLTCIFVSVDGERDTPAAMKSFLEPFGPGFVGLTGVPKKVRDIAASFAVVFFKGMPTDRAGGYNVEHTSQIYLVDAEGRLRATFYDAAADDMVNATRQVLHAPSRKLPRPGDR